MLTTNPSSTQTSSSLFDASPITATSPPDRRGNACIHMSHREQFCTLCRGGIAPGSLFASIQADSAGQGASARIACTRCAHLLRRRIFIPAQKPALARRLRRADPRAQSVYLHGRKQDRSSHIGLLVNRRIYIEVEKTMSTDFYTRERKMLWIQKVRRAACISAQIERIGKLPPIDRIDALRALRLDKHKSCMFSEVLDGVQALGGDVEFDLNEEYPGIASWDAPSRRFPKAIHDSMAAALLAARRTVTDAQWAPLAPASQLTSHEQKLFNQMLDEYLRSQGAIDIASTRQKAAGQAKKIPHWGPSLTSQLDMITDAIVDAKSQTNKHERPFQQAPLTAHARMPAEWEDNMKPERFPSLGGDGAMPAPWSTPFLNLLSWQRQHPWRDETCSFFYAEKLKDPRDEIATPAYSDALYDIDCKGLPILASMSGHKIPKQFVAGQTAAICFAYKTNRDTLGALELYCQNRRLVISAYTDANGRPVQPRGLLGLAAFSTSRKGDPILVFDNPVDYLRFCQQFSSSRAGIIPPACCAINMQAVAEVAARGRVPILCSDAVHADLLPLATLSNARIIRPMADHRGYDADVLLEQMNDPQSPSVVQILLDGYRQNHGHPHALPGSTSACDRRLKI